MSYKIILDSCGELPENLKEDSRFARIPLTLEVGDYHILDDDAFDQKEFLQKVADYPECPKSSCPSPELFMEACNCDAEHIYIITLSSHLSGSYNSAELGKKLYLENHGHKDIVVIDSQSASCGETQIALYAMELEEKGLSFGEIERKVIEYRDRMKTFFVLDNLETLRKNGRMSAVAAMVVQTLNIKPVMSAIEGVIIQKGQAIGIKKALSRMIDMMLAEIPDPESRRFVISNCNCPDRAEYVKGILAKKLKTDNIQILDMAGVSTMYANDGGIIVTA